MSEHVSKKKQKNKAKKNNKLIDSNYYEKSKTSAWESPVVIEKEKLVIDIPKYLIEFDVLDAENWFIFRNRKREDLLKVQSVLTAFAYYLSNADKLHHYWDNTNKYLHDALLNTIKSIHIKEKYAKQLAGYVVNKLLFLMPWNWGNENASNIGKKLVTYLKGKYPEIDVSLATYEDDTRAEREMATIMSNMHLMKSNDIDATVQYTKQITPPLCIEGISVIAKIQSINFVRCYSFID